MTRNYALSTPKRAFGATLAAAAAGTGALLLWRVAMHWSSMSSDDIWAAVFLIACLVLIALCGATFVAFRLVLEGDTIITRGVFRTRHWNVSEFAAFGMLILVVNFVPMTYVRLYDERLRNVVRIPLAARHRREIEDWFGARLSRVVDDGSPARPRPRIVSAPIPDSPLRETQ